MCQIILKCVPSKKALNCFFECIATKSQITSAGPWQGAGPWRQEAGPLGSSHRESGRTNEAYIEGYRCVFTGPTIRIYCQQFEYITTLDAY